MTTTAQTSTSLERKIATYALAAGATLAATGSVDAEVVCQIIDREIQATAADGIGTLEIDMDGDRIADYVFILDVLSDGETVAALGGKENVDGQPNQVKADPASQQSKKAKRFEEGDVVGPGPKSDNGAFLDERFSCATSSPSHFVGVQFFRPAGGEGGGVSEHFGFIGVCVEPATSTTTPARLFVRQVGFETTSSTPAVVGDCELPIAAISGGGCQMGPGRSLVDLAPLGLLALGAAGLGALRRRRREQA